MAPNLVVATKKLFTPHKWFGAPPQVKDERRTEHWDSPVSGTYDYVPGRGWSLIAIDQPAANLIKPIPVKYSRVLKRQMLIDEYNDRKCMSRVKIGEDEPVELGFFRLDDGLAWVNHIDQDGHFLEGPYKLWCLDQKSGKFREMLKGDSPAWRNRQASRPPSLSSSNCSVCRHGSIDDHQHTRFARSASTPLSPYGSTVAQSRANSVTVHDASRSTTRSNSIFDPSPRTSARRLVTNDTVLTATTSPADSIRSATELAAKLEAVKVDNRIKSN